MRLHYLIKNAILGDGTLRVHKKTCHIRYISSSKEYIEFKKSLIVGSNLTRISILDNMQYSGYKDDYSIHRVDISGIPKEEAGVTDSIEIEAVIEQLDEYDLFLWYLDDGSWHKTRNTMHLYCNMLNEKQTNLLCDKIESIHGIRPTIRIDRKKDGRQFYYLYYPRKLVNVLHPIYRQYLIDANLECMYYKVGGLDYVDKKSA